jgi:hypothetical protein
MLRLAHCLISATDYVGKGEEITISAPVRYNLGVLLNEIKERISKMNDEEIDHIKKLILKI